jgi:hypothetical protein
LMTFLKITLVYSDSKNRWSKSTLITEPQFC